MPKLDLGNAPEDILELKNEDIIKEFEATLQAAGASRETIKAYLSAIRDFLSFIGNKSLREITLRDVINWRNSRLAKGFPGAKTGDSIKWQVTLHYYSILLRRFFKWLGLRLNMPGVRRVPAKIDALSDEEIASLLSAARKPQDRLIIQLFLSTGLRSRELLDLRVGDIDFNRRIIRVKSAKYGKERLVTAPPEVFETLEAWIKLNNLKPRDKLFKLTYGSLYKKLKTLAKKAGIDPSRVRPHILRHTFATMAIRRGLSLPSLQRLLGHSDIRTTQVYLHITIDDIKKEYDAKIGGNVINAMNCPSCSKLIPLDAIYCPYCGSSVKEQESGETGI
ncbi:MAG: site-specific integrase [Desulfurococcaceae archaeon]